MDTLRDSHFASSLVALQPTKTLLQQSDTAEIENIPQDNEKNTNGDGDTTVSDVYSTMIGKTKGTRKVEVKFSTSGNKPADVSSMRPVSTTTASKPVGFSVEITEERFVSVPTSTRGRCKLADAVQIVNKLVSHSKSQRALLPRNSKAIIPPITVSELGNAGFKVSGKTGESVLATLRYLGIIKVNKGGIALTDTAAASINTK
jgi:hypothetical protein